MEAILCMAGEEQRMKEKTAAVVLAGGQGKRMNSSVHKQYLPVGGRPVLFYSLKAFEDSFVDEIVLVCGSGEMEYCRREIVEAFHLTKVRAVVEGGRERYHSVQAGLLALRESGAQYVMIHDGARPFVTEEILLRTLEAARQHGACVAGMPVKDTIKLADEDGFAALTPPRDRMWLIQTPQVFSYTLITQAYGRLMEQERELSDRGVCITDDAMVVELLTGEKVKLVEGSYQNIKITTPEDLRVAEAYLDALKRPENLSHKNGKSS